MKIWIDLTNSPHVNFFADLIRQLSADEHQLILTSRPLANTIELLDLHGFEYEIIGKHYGRNRFMKIWGFFRRCATLYSSLKTRQIDAAISHSSFYSPMVAKLLGVPSIYLNDNEHASGNKVAFRFADHIMVPEFLNIDAVVAQGARPSKVIHYPGVKEGVYLWSLPDHTEARDATKEKTIIVRPEPWAAEYYKGSRDFLDDLLAGLTKLGNVVLLPRGEIQAKHYRADRFHQITIPKTPLTLDDFIEQCDLFLGAGGTMTREAAVLGIPTISIYQDTLLSVDEFLVDCGAMVHNPHADSQFVASFLASAERSEPNQELLLKGKQAYELIKTTLLSSSRVTQEHSNA